MIFVVLIFDGDHLARFHATNPHGRARVDVLRIGYEDDEVKGFVPQTRLATDAEQRPHPGSQAATNHDAEDY